MQRLNTMPNLVIECVETYYKKPIEKLERQRELILIDLISMYTMLTKEKVVKAFNLKIKKNNRKKSKWINYDVEWVELSMIIDNIIEEEQIYPVA